MSELAQTLPRYPTDISVIVVKMKGKDNNFKDVMHWLYRSLNAEWHWYRFEHQARGSIHCHGVAKLKNDPGLCKLSETALKGYLAENLIKNSDQAEIEELNLQIAQRKKASETVCHNEEVATYNSEQLLGLCQPIACINAFHSSELAKKASADEMSGLQPTVFLTKVAQVMLTMNLWTDVGFYNGATGTVLEFIFANNHQPPDLPVAVIVQFDDYTGRTEKTAGISYVAISREYSSSLKRPIHCTIGFRLKNHIDFSWCKTEKTRDCSCDPFGSIKIILWEDFVDTIETGNTYDFVDTIETGNTYLVKNIRLKKDNYINIIYFNTAMTGTQINEATAFNQPLAEESDDAQLTILSTTEITAHIIGVTTINIHRTCSCNKAIEEQGKLSNTNNQWYVKLYVQDTTNQANKVYLSLYHSMLVKLVEVADLKVDLNFCNEEDLTIALLDSTGVTCYDTAAKVTDVTPIII
ncbi:Hypothetical predicted protein [Paramuricea clavata]|uniref:Uncharacterized protein n=1 Tax=Paramuricea clavata TaxID=317549 RepID=A0A7D9D9K3_PARCT|nr:Hypothetical predicted protein [Paramuricea clavata]